MPQNEIFGSAHILLLIEVRAVGAIGAVALHGGAPRWVTEAGHHTVQQVGEQERRGLRAGAGLLANQVPTHAVVRRVAGVRPRGIVLVFLQPEGVNGGAGGAPDRGALHDALPAAIVPVPLLRAIRACPAYQIVQAVVGERPRHPAGAATGHVGPGMIATTINLSALMATHDARPKVPMSKCRWVT